MTISHGARAERRERLIEQARNGTSISELTAEFGLNRRYICKILKDYGVVTTSGSGNTLTHVEKRARREQMLAEAAKGASFQSLANKYNLAPGTIVNYCQKAGQTLRPGARLQTVTCAVCGDSHSAKSKYRLRAVCHKPDCRLKFDDNHRDVATHERNLAMLDLSVEGLTLRAIGDKYDISRERVRQIIVEYGGQPHSQKVKTSNCVACNVEMQSIGKVPAKYCSDKCRQDTRQAGWDRTAEIHKARALARDAKWSRFIVKTYICDGCGASFKRSNYIHSITREGYSPEKLAGKRTFCSRDCYLEKRWPDFAGNPNKELGEENTGEISNG